MNKAVSLALFAGGILLIIFGVSAAGSFSSDISRFFTGAPTDKAIWMLIGGVVLSVALHLTVVKLTCNENGDPDILLLARFHTQPGGA